MPLSTRQSFAAERHAACLAQSPEGGPFLFAEFVARDSRLQFRSLNHVHAGAMNLLPLSGHSGHGRTCRWFDPVANDPERTFREPRAKTDGLSWEHDLATGAQLLRQQAIIDVRVSRREDSHFAAETHDRAIPILQFTRLAVDNVALQGRSAARW